jgi:hypothetical protein
MRINQNNYEQYFLDHAEGNLSPEMEKELSDFLEANPDLKVVLDDFDPSPLQTVSMQNDNLKARLKKHLLFTDHITEDNIDEWMIRDIEGLLDDSEENELQEFLSLNPAYSFDYKIFGYTKLSPDLSISYMRKKELKKKTARFPVRHLAWILPAAAAIGLLFIVIRYFTQQDVQATNPIPYAIATIPSLPPQGISAGRISPSLVEKKILVSGTPSRVSRSESIPVANVILQNPTRTLSLNLTVFNLSPIPAADIKDRSLIGNIFNNMVSQVRGSLGGRPKLEKTGKSDFSFWSIAKAGVNGFNSMSDRELELYVRKDESGKVKSYALVEQERLILAKDLNKN